MNTQQFGGRMEKIKLAAIKKAATIDGRSFSAFISHYSYVKAVEILNKFNKID